MLRYTAKRIAQAIPLLFMVSAICWTLIQLAPFDAIDMISRPDMPLEQVQALKNLYGLDKPPHIQFIAWLRGIAGGDFGYSLVNHQSVAEGFAARLPNTILLVLPSYLIALALAIVLGLFAGANRGSLFDRFVDGFCSVSMATPTFWVGMMLLYLFAYVLGALPVLGMYTPGREAESAGLLRHMILPCATLSAALMPENLRYVRSSTISEYHKNYVMVQEAFGSSKARILFVHVIKNVLLPVITRAGATLPMLVTGAFITESIFSWPGVGTWFITAIQGFDYPVIMAVMLFSSVMVILGNLLADLCYCLVDPRIKAIRRS